MKGKVNKCRLVVKQDFHGNFQVNFSLVSLTELCSFWFEKSLHFALVGGQNCP